MNLTALLLLTQLTTVSTPGPELEFDRALVDRLTEAYAELGPVQTATLGGGAPLALESVLVSVRTHHPMLAAATALVRGARGEQLAADGGFDPKLGVGGQLTPEGYYDVEALEAKLSQPTPLWGLEAFAAYRVGRADNFASYDPRETLDGGEVKGGLRLPVLRDGWIDERRANLRAADLGVREAEAIRDAEGLGLAVAGADAYWTWVAAGEAYRVIEHLVRLAERRGLQVEEQVRAGAAPQLYRAENLRSLLKRRDKLVQGLRKLEKASIKLSLFLRGKDGAPQLPRLDQLPERIPVSVLPAARELVEGTNRALEGRPELAALTAKVDALRVSTELADNQILPRLDFEVTVAKDLGNDPDDETLKSLDPLEIKAGLVIEMPLFLRKGRGKAEKARAKLIEATQKLAFTRDKVEAEVRDLWSALRASATRAAVAGQAADVAEAVAAGERARLTVGATSPFVVNLREQAAADARLDDIDARVSFQITATAWRMLTFAGP